MVGIEVSGALSTKMIARASGFRARLPPQNLPCVSVRIQIVPFDLGVKSTSDLWPV